MMSRANHPKRPAHQRHRATAPYRVAVTGHQHLPNHATTQFVTTTLYVLLAQLQRRHPEGVVALSGLAAGADTLFAEAALTLGIPLEAILAHQAVTTHVAPGPARERSMRLRERSQRVQTLAFVTPSVAAYTALGHALVDSCALLLAVWNGRPPVDAGGTGGVVAYARAAGRPVIHIHTLHHTITPVSLP